MTIENHDLLKQDIWDLDDKITRCQDEADRHYLETVSMKKRIAQIDDRIDKINNKLNKLMIKQKPNYLSLNVGGKIDNFMTGKLVKVRSVNNNLLGRNYHYNLVNDRSEILPVTNINLLHALLNTLSLNEIRKGVLIRIKRPYENKYCVWVKKR